MCGGNPAILPRSKIDSADVLLLPCLRMLCLVSLIENEHDQQLNRQQNKDSVQIMELAVEEQQERAVADQTIVPGNSSIAMCSIPHFLQCAMNSFQNSIVTFHWYSYAGAMTSGHETVEVIQFRGCRFRCLPAGQP